MATFAAPDPALAQPADHGRYWRGMSCVYPVYSRRSGGLSIGINLNPDRLCNFDCVYCQVDRRGDHAAPPVDVDRLERELNTVIDLAESGTIWADPRFCHVDEAHQRWVDIAFSGDGEPTACGQFPEAVQRVARIRHRRGEDGVRLVLITNATLLHQAGVRVALRHFTEQDQIWAKLDAGCETDYRAINRSTVPLERIFANITDLGRQRGVVIQSMFCRIGGAAPSPRMLRDYVDAVKRLRAGGCRIDGVQAYTVARQPAESDVMPLSDAELNAVASVLRAGLPGLPLEVFGSGDHAN